MLKYTRRHILNSIVSLLLGAVAGCSIPSVSRQDFCLENRAAWDLGSGSLKVKVAKVNICELRIVQVLFEESEKISLKEDLERQPQVGFSNESMQKIRNFIQAKQEKMKSFGITRQVGVATAAYRESPNAEAFVQQLNRDFPVRLEIISQQREGELGYQAGQALKPKDRAGLPVWDMGGGSQQLSFIQQGELKIEESSMASVGFKNEVLKKVKPANWAPRNSPNPLSLAEIQSAQKRATETAQGVVRGFSNWRSQPEVLGIGGVLAVSVAKRLGQNAYTPADVEGAIKKSVGLTDQALNTPYAATEITNLIFVAAMMKALQVNKVYAVKANLTDGVLIHGAY